MVQQGDSRIRGRKGEHSGVRGDSIKARSPHAWVFTLGSRMQQEERRRGKWVCQCGEDRGNVVEYRGTATKACSRVRGGAEWRKGNTMFDQVLYKVKQGGKKRCSEGTFCRNSEVAILKGQGFHSTQEEREVGEGGMRFSLLLCATVFSGTSQTTKELVKLG